MPHIHQNMLQEHKPHPHPKAECACHCSKDCDCGCQEGKPCTCQNGCERKHHGSCKCYTALLLALGLTLAGFFPGYYYYKTKMCANTVVVKGLAEMNVKADLAVWEMKYVVTGNDVAAAQKEILGQTEIITAFLAEKGFEKEEITVGRLETNDLYANPYRSNDISTRFILTQSVSVASSKVDLVSAVLNESGNLVAKGIVFNQDYGSPVSYVFTKLNDIKPEMLTRATQNAREAAAQFAKSSGSKVGKIKHANQGQFSILPAVETSTASQLQQIEKKVRVVSTVEYWLN